MPFLERLQSAMILKTPMHHQHEAHIVEHLHAPFYEAIRKSDEQTVALMIEDGFDVDFHEVAHIPPLIFSIIHKKPRITHYLLKHGANVNISTSQGESALHVSIQLEDTDMIKLLLDFGAEVTLKDTLINPELLTLFNDESLFSSNEVSCFTSAKLGDIIRLSLTCNKNHSLFKSSQHGHTLLHLATYSGNKKLIIYLLNKGLNIDEEDNNANTALNIAVKFQNYDDIVALLIKRNATLDHKNSQSHTPLTSALRNGYAHIAKMLLDNGANIHIVDNIHTPLTLTHEAISKYPHNAKAFRELETELLIQGAHVDIPTNALRWTPLYVTISKMQTHILKLHLNLLIGLGAQINYLDTNKRTPLMIASSLGRYEAVEVLLNNYAKINLLDSFGWSALMLGVYYNHYNVVKLLLSTGADANLSSPQQLSALKIAKQHKREKIATLLLKYGATEEENTE
jgi:ankyrin repeat protein